MVVLRTYEASVKSQLCQYSKNDFLLREIVSLYQK